MSPADPSPFTDKASVTYGFFDPEGSSRALTLSRSEHKASWNGYKRRISRNVYYVGVTSFVPKIEKKDLSVYAGAKSKLLRDDILDDSIANEVGRILSVDYSSASEYTVGKGDKSVDLVALKRGNVAYSENNMGFGEGRIAYLVREMESAPKCSLFLLEEPEIALHADAQRRLVTYLIEVCFRHGHQVIVTTHSRDILAAAPHESLTYLERGSDGQVRSLPGMDGYRAANELGRLASADSRRVVIVEDYVAAELMRAALRIDRAVGEIQSIKFIEGGDGGTISRIAKTLKSQWNDDVIVILDGDMNKNRGQDVGWEKSDEGYWVGYLPGALPPEREIVRNDRVVAGFQKKYCVNILDIVASVPDHHNYFREIGRSIGQVPEVVLNQAVELFWLDLSDYRESLACSIREAWGA